MKIGIPCFVLDRGQSGISKYVIELLRSLRKQNIDNQIDVFVPSQDESVLQDVQTIRCSPITRNPIISIFWHHFVLPFKQLDLIHIPSIRRIPLWKSGKLVATVHDLAVFRFPEKYGWLRGMYHRFFLKRSLKICDHIITVSQATKNDLVELTSFPGKKITVIYSGIDHEVFHPSNEKKENDPPFLLYVSRIEHPAKNHIRLIEAFELFKQTYNSPHRLVLAGGDWNGADRVHQRAQESRFKDEIDFLGYIPTKQLVHLYQTCDVAVFPSLLEGFGFPVLEALACGSLVACSKGSSLDEVGGDCVYSFSPESKQEIADSIQKALEDPKKEERRKKGIDHAASFTWDKAADETLQVYRKVGSNL